MVKKTTKKLSGKIKAAIPSKVLKRGPKLPAKVSGFTQPKAKSAKVTPKPDKTTQQEVRRIRPDNPKTDKNTDGKPDEARESMTPHKGPDKKPKGPQWSKPNEVVDDDPLGVQTPAENDVGDVMADDDDDDDDDDNRFWGRCCRR